MRRIQAVTEFDAPVAKTARDPVPSPAPRSFPLREVVKPFVVSRLLSGGLILVMATVAGHRIARQGFARWDGKWYLAIAQHGYPSVLPHARQSVWAFFPLLPATIRVLGTLGIPLQLAGVIITHLAFLVALVGLHRLMSKSFSPHATTLAIWLIALFPASFVFSMVYPSAIFLAASVWGFVFVSERQDVAAAVAAVVATLARPNGIVLAIALAFAIGLSSRRLVRVCGPAMLALLGWMAYNLAKTGDALAFFHAKHAWHELTLLGLFERNRIAGTVHLLLACAAVAAIVAVRERIPRSWSVLTVLYLVPSLALGIIGLGRYTTECFPPFAAGGELLARQRRPVRGAVFTAFVVTQVFFAYWVIARRHVP
jgi:Mannosyltransferase (PIG-V)